MTVGEASNEMVNAPPSQAKGQPAKLSVVLINGERFRMSASEFWALMTDRHSLIFFALSGALVTYIYPKEYTIGLTWWQVVVAFALLEVVLFLSIILQFVLLSKVLRGYDRAVIPATLVVLIAVIVTEIVKRPYTEVFWGPGWVHPVSFVQATVTEYVWCFILEVIFSLFVISHTRLYPSVVLRPRSARPPAAMPPESPAEAVLPSVAPLPVPPNVAETAANIPQPPALAASIRIAGETIDLSKLRMIRAEEHYIRVISEGDNILLRYRMMDAVALIPENYGLQVHRSLWLAFAMVERFSQLPDGKLLVVLKDKSEVFVPRARRKEVEAQLVERCG